jgi:hypothetical protein
MKDMVSLLVNNNIEYRVVCCSSNKTTILIKNIYLKKLTHLMKLNGYKKLCHPYGKLYEYTYLYQLHEFKLFYKNGIIIEIFFELPCMSLTPHTWIPLDRTIQDSIWLESNQVDGVLYLDEINDYIFKLTWAIFTKKSVDETDINFLQKKKYLLNNTTLMHRLSLIFFKYAKQLQFNLQNDKYSSLRHDYITFNKY